MSLETTTHESAWQRGIAGEPLTRREWQALTLSAQGLEAKEVARHLCMHPRTVDTHMHRSVKKLGARNQKHAIAIAISRGITSLDTVIPKQITPKLGRPRKKAVPAWLPKGWN